MELSAWRAGRIFGLIQIPLCSLKSFCLFSSKAGEQGKEGLLWKGKEGLLWKEKKESYK